MSYKKPLAECNFGTPAAFGETTTGSLPPEVGVVDGAQVYDRDEIDNSYVVEADDPAQQHNLREYEVEILWERNLRGTLTVLAVSKDDAQEKADNIITGGDTGDIDFEAVDGYMSTGSIIEA